MCVYKMVVRITKEAWEKCGIKTLIYHNKEEKINELWQKISDIEIQHGHSNNADVVLKRIRKYWGKKKKKKHYKKKKKKHYKKRKKKYKAFFEGEENIFITEKLARDITEHCKLP